MGKKLSTLTAGIATAAVAAASIAPAAFGYGLQNTVNLNYDETQGAVTRSIVTHLRDENTVNLTVTPAENYVCENITYSYNLNRSNHTVTLGCDNLTFEFPDFWVTEVTVNVTFAEIPEEEEPTEEEPTEEEPVEEEPTEPKVAPDTGIASAAILFAIAAILIAGGALAAHKANTEA